MNETEFGKSGSNQSTASEKKGSSFTKKMAKKMQQALSTAAGDLSMQEALLASSGIATVAGIGLTMGTNVDNGDEGRHLKKVPSKKEMEKLTEETSFGAAPSLSSIYSY
mmetsp:Transcript_53137/g.97149  ORF Transcript_53137/g.97149 Transcript_53137/m.97149 type:complete len:109 (-) Transcript_53137:22-348(-)